MTRLQQPSTGAGAPPAASQDERTGGAGGSSGAGAYRVLIVDDNPSIHVDFRCILGGDKPADPELDELSASLLGIEPASPGIRLLLDSAYQGEEAFAAVRDANAEGRPYALVFMDIRMQPGWSGVDTAARLLDIDGLVHIILCTAYADHEWRRQIQALTSSDRVLLLKKPFDPLEVRQLTNAMCHKWTLALRDKRRLQELERAVSDKTRALEDANEHLRREIAERARAERELSRAQHLEGLGRLAAGLCHEINNPLTFIVGGLDAMGSAFQEVKTLLPREKRGELEDLLHSVAVGADRITQIVRNVKLLSRRNDADADTELVDVHAAVDTAVDMLRPGPGPHVELLIERDRDSPVRVLGRRLGLEQVLLNLLENSTYALTEVADRRPVIRVSVRALDGRRAQITVADTGPGIPGDMLDKVFEPFFTTKPVNHGTGLGLAICHSLVSSMSGTIEVESEPGRGTTFTITLPVASADLPAEASSPAAEAALEPEGGVEVRGRVLIVDDEPFILKVIRHGLREHDVTTASNIEDALSHCMENTFDLILSDIRMPEGSGCDFYHRLAAARPGEEVKIVFLTGGILIEEVLIFLATVSNRCLEKPVSMPALRALVAERVNARASAEQSLPAPLHSGLPKRSPSPRK